MKDQTGIVNMALWLLMVELDDRLRYPQACSDPIDGLYHFTTFIS